MQNAPDKLIDTDKLNFAQNKDNLSSIPVNIENFKDFSYNGRSVIKKQKKIKKYPVFIYGLIMLIVDLILVNLLIYI